MKRSSISKQTKLEMAAGKRQLKEYAKDKRARGKKKPLLSDYEDTKVSYQPGGGSEYQKRIESEAWEALKPTLPLDVKATIAKGEAYFNPVPIEKLASDLTRMSWQQVAYPAGEGPEIQRLRTRAQTIVEVLGGLAKLLTKS